MPDATLQSLFPRQPRRIWRVYLLILVGGLLLSTAFYVFGIRPLDDRVRMLHAERIAHDFGDVGRAFDGIVARHLGLAEQVASRTAIRQRQADFLQGRESLDDLAAFALPKLADALKANAEIVGIVRHDPSGRRLFAVGEEIPAALSAACRPGEEDRARPLPLLRTEGQRRFAYCSPIRDDRHGLVGFDVVVADDVAVQALVDTHTGEVIVYALGLDGGELAFRPAVGGDAAMRAVRRADASTPGLTVLRAPTRVPGLSLCSVVDQARFFAPQREQSRLLLLTLAVAAAAILALSVVLMRPIIRSLLDEQHLIEMASFDRLTGLLNWGTFHRVLDHEFARAQRYRRPLSLIMFDIDHFKRVNDTYGHPVGDEVLRAIGRTCSGLFRQTDSWARYGGEEFMAVLPETQEPYAESLADRLRQHIAANPIATAAGMLSVTVSAGVLSCRPGVDGLDKVAIVAEVDKALYASKEAGRNRVTVAVLTGRTDTSPPG